jgi:phosphoglycolate phosphatase
MITHVIPCLIFDLDGTLIDSLPGITHSLNHTLSAHQLPTHSQAVVRSFVGNGLKVLIQRAAPAHADETLIDSLVATFKENYATSWKSGSKPYPAIPLLLQSLQKDGYQLAVLSNKTHDFTTEITRQTFPLIHFEMILGQQEGVPHKPQPAGIYHIAQTMGVAPEQCVMIGDSITDMETAANAEIPSIAVTWGYHDRDQLLNAGATHIAEQPSDILDIIGRMSE